MNNMNIGLGQFFEAQIEENETIGRIMMYAQNHYTIMTDEGVITAGMTGKMQYESIYPRIGDFVVYTTSEDKSLHLINKVLDRKTCLSRKVAGLRSSEQVIAANMDYLFIVMSLNDDFNIRRLERYMIGAWESGAEPIVILTKLDLCDDLESLLDQVDSVTFGIKTIAISALENQGLDQLETYNVPGKTIALVGSSGVGKSTLINALAGKEVMKTDGLRNDDKGHHTTTHREMIFTDKAILIDTPGMREFASFEGSKGLEHEFQDIMTLMSQCKFSDCQHKKELGCAVLEALDDGRLDADRYKSYLSLQKEIERQDKKRSQQQRISASREAKNKRKSKPRVKNWNSANY